MPVVGVETPRRRYTLGLLVVFPVGAISSVEVNGGPGALYLDAQQRLIGVVALDIAGGRITSNPLDRQPRQAGAPRATRRLHIATEVGEMNLGALPRRPRAVPPVVPAAPVS